ncbi:MAG: lamin tail domain-containing protein [Bacteroidota bacterium]
MMHTDPSNWYKKYLRSLSTMGSLVCWVLFLVYPNIANAQTTCSAPFFSEYIEGSSANKGLELFNPSDEAINLANYTIEVYVNGNSDPRFTLVPQGFLAPKATYSISNSNADFAANSDTSASVAGFNGDDAVILIDSEGNTLDAIGVVGEDPGISWTAGEGSTSNHTLVRNPTVTEGTANWTEGATQWTILEQDDFSNLGVHTFDTSACAESTGPNGLTIVFNEFQFADLDQVELKNYSSDTIDISTWWLCAQFVYVQLSDDALTITGNTNVAPGEIVTVTGFNLDDQASDLGLYSNNSFANSDAMVAFVQYGGAGIGRENVAAAAGIWEAGDFITIDAGNSAEFTGTPQSGSALLASVDYVEQEDPTFGEENKLVCTANAGTLIGLPVADDDCEDGSVTLIAEPNGDASIPSGYNTTFVLTSGDNLLVIATSESPEFEVGEDGFYTIHTLVYNPDTASPDFLDLSLITPESTGFDLLDLIIENDICASLDAAGAPFDIVCTPTDTCAANAGTLTADPFGEIDCIDPEGGNLEISATQNGDANVPEAFTVSYVLTTGEGLIIQNLGESPNFIVTEPGSYTIHTLVYAGNEELMDFLDLSGLVLGETTAAEVLDIIKEANVCADLDVEGASFIIEICEIVDTCAASSGSLTPDEFDGCLGTDSPTTEISASSNGDATIPEGYTQVYVLTSGTELIIRATSDLPTFTVDEAGLYTIHSLVAELDSASDNFLDLSVIELGKTTGAEVVALIAELGLCASLDVAGAPFEVDSCTVIEPAPNCLFFSEYVEGSSDNKALEIYNACDETVDLSNYQVLTFVNGATEPRFSFIPGGILEPGEVLVICEGSVEFPDQCDTTSSVTGFNGNDAIALVNLTNGDTLDIIGIIGEDPGTEWEVDNGTTANNTLIRKSFVIQGNTDWTTAQNEWLGIGLDVADSLGTHPHEEGPIDTTDCIADAGSLTPNDLGEEDCVIPDSTTIEISATPNGDAVIEVGFGRMYVLTQGEELLILETSSSPAFEISQPGFYTIHTLVLNADPESSDFITIDTAIVLGQTTGVQVVELIESSGICAALDVTGASFTIGECIIDEPCTADAGVLVFSTVTPFDCLSPETPAFPLTVEVADAVIPEGYTLRILLAEGADQVIQEISEPGSFSLSEEGIFTFHSFVYNPDTTSENFFDVSTIILGSTITMDVMTSLEEAGICADFFQSDGDGFEIDSCALVEEAPNCLFFSEYVEGSSSNKALEVYNACDDTVDLSNYEVLTFVNGDTSPRFSFIPEGELAPGEVLVICNGGVEFLEKCDTTASITGFNGNDAIALVNLSNGDTLDIIGVIGEDPGTEWEVDNGTTANNTLIRKSFVVQGNLDWSTAQNEWLGIGLDVVDSLGTHPHEVAPIDTTQTCEIDPGSIVPDEIGEPGCIVPGETESVTLSATPVGDIVLQEGFESRYVLTTGEELLILELSDEPTFEVTEEGLYTIHTLVINSDPSSQDFITLDTSIIMGETTGLDILEIIDSTGICAVLDPSGAPFSLAICDTSATTCEADAGSLTADELPEGACLDEETPSLVISASIVEEPIVPEGSIFGWILTEGSDLSLVAADSIASFEVSEPGSYTIHTVVLDTTNEFFDTLDTASIEAIIEEFENAVDIIIFLSEANICAAVDVEGASFTIEDCLDPDPDPDPTGDCPEVCTLSNWNGNLGGPDYVQPLNQAVVIQISPLDPYLMHGDRSNYQRFVWETQGIFTKYEDRATITGRLVSKVDSGAIFDLEMLLVSPMNWEEFSSIPGRGEIYGTPGLEDQYLDWEYWYISDESKMIGAGSLEGIEISMYHAPRDSSKALQVGIGANHKDFDFGIAGWFGYTGVFNGEEFSALGDITVDIDECTKADTCGENASQSFVKDISVESVPESKIKLQWTVSPELGLSAGLFVERASSNGSFEVVGQLSSTSTESNFNYTFIDDASNLTGKGEVLYRIRVKDTNYQGFSETVRLKLSDNYRFDLFPNPAERFLNVRDNNPQVGTYTFKVFDLNGRVLQEKSVKNFNGNYLLDGSQLPNSVHILQITAPDGGISTLRFSIK